MPLHDPAHAFVPYPDAPAARAGTGPLSDLSFAAKDLFDVAGYPTGGGNPIVLAMSGIKTPHRAHGAEAARCRCALRRQDRGPTSSPSR